MNLLARACGLQERIRPTNIPFQGDDWATFAPLKDMLTHDGGLRSPLGPPTNSGIAPASKLFTREAGRIILNLLPIGEKNGRGR